MGQTKKNGRQVTLGGAAYSFYDASTGIGFAKGEVKFLTNRQLSSAKIKRALHTGHLQYAPEKEVPADPEPTETVLDRFKVMVSSGMTAKKISKAFTDDQVDEIAKEYGLTRDEGETSESVVESVIAQIEEEKKG